ncbi:acyltransferase family protein [Pannonibacter phragmitetus]|jgi:peptidoglycan/LPS O-acetylase OafA/YrhL|uniref:acyltransferase family protein n=1 Tax=Pannonibacter phragmitetus TaxID=121719 RepID=UPI0013CE45C0|nr:acyltransferase [Pannonibacter phragmitetus]
MTETSKAVQGRGKQRYLLAQAAEKGANSYGIIRVVAAFLVIWTHSYSVLGGEQADEPLRALSGYSVGSHAVNIFFSLSGFMVAASWERSKGFIDFTLARMLRIIPALIFVNVLIVIVSGLFLTVSSKAFWTGENIGSFLVSTIVLFKAGSTLEGVFAYNPWPGVINIPIWTIKYEIICYASLALLMLAIKLSRLSVAKRRLTLFVLLALSASVMMWQGDAAQFDNIGHLARFFFAFYLGVGAWFERDRIRLGWTWLVAIWLVVSLAIAIRSATMIPLAMLGTAYLAFWTGSFTAGSVQRAADRTDLSYGMYISGFFIQQLLAAAYPGQSIATNTISATIIAALFAWISWTVVERPALKLRGRIWRWATRVRAASAIIRILVDARRG